MSLAVTASEAGLQSLGFAELIIGHSARRTYGLFLNYPGSLVTCISWTSLILSRPRKRPAGTGALRKVRALARVEMPFHRHREETP